MIIEDAIRRYFDSWIAKDSSVIREVFADDISYVESHGPVYEGKEQCIRWFEDWNRKGSVLVWDIKDIRSDDETFFVEWHFECEYENSIDGFDGISVIEAGRDGRFRSIREFQSQSRHYRPYGE